MPVSTESRLVDSCRPESAAELVTVCCSADTWAAIVPNLLTVWQIVQIALVERDKRATLAGILFGVADGLFGLGQLGAFLLDDYHAIMRLFTRTCAR